MSILALVLILVIPFLIFQGYVLSCGWEWFILPTFGIQTPSLPVCIGLILVFNLIQHAPYSPEDDSDKSKRIGAIFLKPFIGLLFMWIIHQFV